MSRGSPIHVVPGGDLLDHVQTHACWCLPTSETFENGRMLLIHHSADGREQWEGLNTAIAAAVRGLNAGRFPGTPAS